VALDYLKALVCVFVLVIMQVSVTPQLYPFGGGPDLVAILVVALALWRGLEIAAVAGFVGGLLLDAILFRHLGLTSLSYLACARRMIDAGGAFYPQFATHNAHTLAAILELAGGRKDWEFQRLHGMGEALYGEIVGPDKLNRPCRVYAPVGSRFERPTTSTSSLTCSLRPTACVWW